MMIRLLKCIQNLGKQYNDWNNFSKTKFSISIKHLMVVIYILSVQKYNLTQPNLFVYLKYRASFYFYFFYKVFVISNVKIRVCI